LNVFVANLGSTSLKFRLFEMEHEVQLAQGTIERIGHADSTFQIRCEQNEKRGQLSIADHAAAIEFSLQTLGELGIDCQSGSSDFAIGFKAVHGGKFTGVELVDDGLIAEMERFRRVAPAHNPPYTSAMRMLNARFPGVRQIAAFETDFHRNAPQQHQLYAIPWEWSERYQVAKRGFHGASHRYIAERLHVIAPDCRRVISCHLGGSSSLCAIEDGKSLGASMGMSPQSGIPQSNRCGDFDPFALPLLMDSMNKTLHDILDDLANSSGLLGLSGVSSDLRQIIAEAANGNARAQTAIDVYIAEVRRWLGGMLVRMNGADAIVFTGGIGERSVLIRQRVCQSLDQLGIVLDERANSDVGRNERASENEFRIECDGSRVQIWVVPTNEEIVVARQVVALLENQQCS